jgi:hypothetical protein
MVVKHKSTRHFICHGVISLDFIRFVSNIADPLTKDLTRNKLFNHCEKWAEAFKLVLSGGTLSSYMAIA